MKATLAIITLFCLFAITAHCQVADFHDSNKSDSLISSAQKVFSVKFRASAALDTIDFKMVNLAWERSPGNYPLAYDSAVTACPIFVEYRDSVYTDGRYIHRVENGAVEVRIIPLATDKYIWFQKTTEAPTYYYYKITTYGERLFLKGN